MKKIKKISQKISENTFSEPIPIGVDGSNVDINGTTLDKEISRIDNVLTKVPVSRGGTGLNSISENSVLIGGPRNEFKIISFDSTPTEDSKNLVNSGSLYNALYDALHSGMFQIINEDTLFSSCISAYAINNGDEVELRLIGDYFDIESMDPESGRLIIK